MSYDLTGAINCDSCGQPTIREIPTCGDCKIKKQIRKEFPFASWQQVDSVFYLIGTGFKMVKEGANQSIDMVKGDVEKFVRADGAIRER